jgi:hypothetical protein
MQTPGESQVVSFKIVVTYRFQHNRGVLKRGMARVLFGWFEVGDVIRLFFFAVGTKLTS